MVSRKDVGNVLQAGAGDPMAVAKQNINAERIKNEMNYDDEIAFQVTRQSFLMTTDGEPFKNEF